MISSEFLVTSLVIAMIPGTGVVFTISTGLLLGWRASIFASLGCTAGILPHLLASVMGMTFAVFVVYGVPAHSIRAAVLKSPRFMIWLQRSFAAAFALLGVNLALSER